MEFVCDGFIERNLIGNTDVLPFGYCNAHVSALVNVLSTSFVKDSEYGRLVQL
jgi:hypothetical protein